MYGAIWGEMIGVPMDSTGAAMRASSAGWLYDTIEETREEGINS